MQSRLCKETNAIGFEVKYIGQAYGDAGSRSALDRLLKHETLQKIALKGTPDGYRITLLLLEIQPSNQVFTMMICGSCPGCHKNKPSPQQRHGAERRRRTFSSARTCRILRSRRTQVDSSAQSVYIEPIGTNRRPRSVTGSGAARSEADTHLKVSRHWSIGHYRTCGPSE